MIIRSKEKVNLSGKNKPVWALDRYVAEALER